MKQHNLKILFSAMMIAAMTLVGCGGSQAPAAPAQQAAAVDTADLAVNIDAQTLESLRGRDDVVIIDVREDWEYAEGHIPGAVLLPLGQVPNRLNDIPKDKTVVAVCRSGNRSNQATQFLRDQGFDNIHNMTGGMISWSQSGYDIEK
jgi:rhodanese-related sulfurtransferase